MKLISELPKLRSLISVGSILLFAQFGQATQKGFVKVRIDRQLYYEYEAPQNNQPTVVLLNGLTYGTEQYAGLAKSLVKKGIGVLRFDFDGMGKTLLKYGPAVNPFPVEQQASDLKTLLSVLNISKPYNLMGLSYGGGVLAYFAMKYPQLVDNLIMVSPYTQPLASQEQWIKSQIWLTRQTQPWNRATDDELYDFFLHEIIYATYPQAEPIVLEHPFKLEAIFNLIRGIRKFVPIEVAAEMPKVQLHLVVAGLDQYIPQEVLENYWKALPQSNKMSRLQVLGVEHKITEVVPGFMASWITEILNKNKLLYKGKSFTGDTMRGLATSGKDIIELSGN